MNSSKGHEPVPSERSLRFLVYGAGAVGSTFGGFLSRYHQVTLLGREAHVNAIRQNGLSVSGIWGTHRFERFEKILSREQDLKEAVFDAVLVTVKAYDTESAARALKKSISPKTIVISLQNGLGNIETLHRYFPKNQVIAGRVIFGAKIPAPGTVEITVMAEPAAIGETSRRGITPRVRLLAKLFDDAGVPSEPCADVQSRLWAKVNYNCALNPLASLLNCHYGHLTEKPETRNVMNCVIEEIYAAAKKNGVKLTPASPAAYQKLFYSKLVPRTYNHHPSMLQDLRAGKRTEIESLNGAVQRLGNKIGVPVPVNALLAQMIREREIKK